MISSIKRFLIGRPLKSDELGEQKLNKTKALAILSSDALSSVAYGPEQILIVLVTVGAAAFWYSIPIAVGVLILLAALILSYRQIIFAYPHGGGAYVVSETVGEAQRRHYTWPTASAALGRSMTAGLMLGSMLKGDEKLTIKIEGKDQWVIF
jgi:Hsp33 protein